MSRLDDEAWVPEWLRVYGETGSATKSCRAAGVSMSTVLRRRKALPDFDAQVRDAQDRYFDAVVERVLTEKEVMRHYFILVCKPHTHTPTATDDGTGIHITLPVREKGIGYE